MSRRIAATFLFASTVTILVTQYFWMTISIPGSCPTPVSAPVSAVPVTVTVPVTVPVPCPTEDAREEPPLQGPRNSTLGFQKIYYISMPQRTDRQDMMALIGGYLNLELTRMDGVNGSDVAPKAYPFDTRNPPPPPPGRKLPRPAGVGCWRAHANIWTHMVTTGVSSALILEDDADFSVGIRDIMEGLSKQLQNIVGAKNGEPYGIVEGNSWDTLTLGHCGYRIVHPAFNPKAAKKIRVWVDPLAPPNRYSTLIPNSPSPRVRLVAPSKGSVCAHGYAVTKEGAMRLLYNIGGPGHTLNQAWDLIIRELLDVGVLKGFLSVPDIVAQWKVQDWRDTDIQTQPEQMLKKMFRKGSGPEIVESVREAIARKFGYRNIWKQIEEEEETTEEEEGEEITMEEHHMTSGHWKTEEGGAGMEEHMEEAKMRNEVPTVDEEMEDDDNMVGTEEMRGEEEEEKEEWGPLPLEKD